MELHAAELVKKAADYNDYDISIYKEYSGRGMFGETTTGLVCSDINVLIKVIAFASKMFTPDDNYLFFEDFLNDLLPVKMDSLGKDVIFY